MLVGMPITLVLIIVAIERFAFTFTCYTAAYKCEYALGAQSGSEDDGALASVVHRMATDMGYLTPMDAPPTPAKSKR